jgi:hypothetical protein
VGRLIPIITHDFSLPSLVRGAETGELGILVAWGLPMFLAMKLGFDGIISQVLADGVYYSLL